MIDQQFEQKPERMLIFDFDGVVVDTEKLHFDSWQAAFEEMLGQSLTPNGENLVGLSLSQIYSYWMNVAGKPNKLTDAQKAMLLARKTELFYEIGARTLRPMPGVVDLAKQALSCGWYVSIASRARRQRMLRTLEMIGLPATFDLMLGAEDCVDRVTDRKVAAKTAVFFNLDPAACVLIEDSRSGVRDGRDCGIGRVIGLTTTFDRDALFAAGANEVVDLLNEVRL